MGLPSCPGKSRVAVALAIAIGEEAGMIRASACEKTMLRTGAAITASTVSERTTTATGRRITKRAVCAHRPSAFGVTALLRTTNLSMRGPMRAKIAGNGSSETKTATATTLMPA